MTQPTNDLEALAVEQCDRDAAKSLLGRDDAGPSWWSIDSGNADCDPLVQAFSRHRLTALRAQDAAPVALSQQACSISKSGSTVTIYCDDGDLANGMFDWLCSHPSPNPAPQAGVSEALIVLSERETEEMLRELDITSADNTVLWLETNMPDSGLPWLACRIVEAHERAARALRVENEHLKSEKMRTPVEPEAWMYTHPAFGRTLHTERQELKRLERDTTETPLYRRSSDGE